MFSWRHTYTRTQLRLPDAHSVQDWGTQPSGSCHPPARYAVQRVTVQLRSRVTSGEMARLNINLNFCCNYSHDFTSRQMTW